MTYLPQKGSTDSMLEVFAQYPLSWFWMKQEAAGWRRRRRVGKTDLRK